MSTILRYFLTHSCTHHLRLLPPHFVALFLCHRLQIRTMSALQTLRTQTSVAGHLLSTRLLLDLVHDATYLLSLTCLETLKIIKPRRYISCFCPFNSLFYYLSKDLPQCDHCGAISRTLKTAANGTILCGGCVQKQRTSGKQFALSPCSTLR